MSKYTEELKLHEERTALEMRAEELLTVRKQLFLDEAEIKKKHGFKKTEPEYEYENSKDYLESQKAMYDNICSENILNLDQTMLTLSLERRNREANLEFTKKSERAETFK
jgi:hypothetical protein